MDSALEDDGVLQAHCGKWPEWICDQCAQWHQLPEATLPVMVDVLDHVVRKDRAAPDMFGNMQSPVIRMEEQFLTQLEIGRASCRERV